MLMVSNNEYRFEPRNLTERERLDGGVLGIYLLNEERRAGLLRIALHSLVFKLEEATSFESYKSPEAVVHTHRKHVRVALDGEVFRLSTPLRYRSLPASLRVITGVRSRESGDSEFEI